MPTDDHDPRWELVYAEAPRALTFQQSTLDNLRSRATLLTAGAALVGSALGAPALSDGKWGPAAVLAIAALGSVLAAAGIICAPWWRWRFVGSATRPIVNYGSGDPGGFARTEGSGHWAVAGRRRWPVVVAILILLAIAAVAVIWIF